MDAFIQEFLLQIESVIGLLDTPYIWPAGVIFVAFLWVTRTPSDSQHIIDSSRLTSGWWTRATPKSARPPRNTTS